jgi:hypothetical protein
MEVFLLRFFAMGERILEQGLEFFDTHEIRDSSRIQGIP